MMSRIIIKESCERSIVSILHWLIRDAVYAEDLAEIGRVYINTDLSEYSNALEGWC